MENLKSFKISHYNGKRLADNLVIYNKSGTTGTNKYGFEACISNGKVISCGGNNSKIPDDGFVVSGHGKAALFLADVIFVGANVFIDKENQLFSVDFGKEAQDMRADMFIQEIQSRVSVLKSSNEDFDKNSVDELLSKAIVEKTNGNFESVKKITEEAYYLTSRSFSGETRGIWHRPTEQSEEDVEKTVKKLCDAGFNLILIETNYSGYANAQRCVHDYLPIRKEFENGFDVIDAFIKIGKKHGMQIHSWFENFFYGVVQNGCPMAKIHPEWMAKRKDGSLLLDAYDGFYFLNPALKEVRVFLLERCRELLDNYDFDGLQLDYIRYPLIKDIDHAAGFDESTKALFFADTGIEIDKIGSTDEPEWDIFVKWCAEKVTEYVRSVYMLIQEYREKGRNIQLTTAVIGDPDEAINKKCQDWRYWVKQGWLDSIYPMAYFNDASEVKSEVGYMVENYGEAPNISGISPMMNDLPIIESTKQIEAAREAGAKGVAFFAFAHSTDEQLESLKKGVFRNR